MKKKLEKKSREEKILKKDELISYFLKRMRHRLRSGIQGLK